MLLPDFSSSVGGLVGAWEAGAEVVKKMLVKESIAMCSKYELIGFAKKELRAKSA